jgi:hypothetical protein
MPLKGEPNPDNSVSESFVTQQLDSAEVRKRKVPKDRFTGVPEHLSDTLCPRLLWQE